MPKTLPNWPLSSASAQVATDTPSFAGVSSTFLPIPRLPSVTIARLLFNLNRGNPSVEIVAVSLCSVHHFFVTNLTKLSFVDTLTDKPMRPSCAAKIRQRLFVDALGIFYPPVSKHHDDSPCHP